MIHREGYPTIGLTLLFSAAIIGATNYFTQNAALVLAADIISVVLLIIVLQFFRNPSRNTTINDRHILAPADGKVVVIEEVEEPEYFKDKRIQVSVFMSPINVHVNRFPIGGLVKYVKYHPGLYLVAWHPKSSTENERSTVVVELNSGKAILFRQIAGALARRIVYYCKEGDKAVQGAEFGFIKFGSRVDLFLPIGTKINVQLNQVVRGGETVIASFGEG
ncbi:MAG: phosphatidylserine decarboxylase family protein [Bacteroidetes bacterium]|nr:phosphatidylserine decarboxylase family protein [Bacteroidota bacterium]